MDTNTPPLSISKPAFLVDGSFQFQLSSSAGLVFTLQSSTNLSSWQSLQTFTNAGSLTSYTATNSGRPNTFYRVAVP
jgi:hypothetical protein